MSGPVGGVAAAVELAGRTGAETNLVTLDIGGTSADVSIIDRGDPVTRTLGQVGSWPVMVSMVDIHSIGAGGGSIARVDDFEALAVGPQSAGASPGPACYGRGGEDATVTDAHLVLGRLNPSYFAGGDLELDPNAARRAIAEHVASHYGMTLEQAALGIITVINSTMARLLWEVMIGQGYDPRDFSLLAFGGAGPLHACELAEVLGIAEVIVPAGPGTFSAYGMIAADIRHDFERMMVSERAPADDELVAAYAELERLALRQIESEHIGYERVAFRRLAELRYEGQHHALAVELPPASENGAGLLMAAREAFHEKHQRLYRFRRDDAVVELLRIQVSATGRVERVDHRRDVPDFTATPLPSAQRRLHLAEGYQDAPVFRRADLPVGFEVAGPCLIEEPSSTTYLPPACLLTVDQDGNLRIIVPPPLDADGTSR
jgi:N-methylhydantoinase A